MADVELSPLPIIIRYSGAGGSLAYLVNKLTGAETLISAGDGQVCSIDPVELMAKLEEIGFPVEIEDDSDAW